MGAKPGTLIHEHTYRFLREEEQNVRYDRNPTWHIFDVYYCENCLDYRRIHVRTEEPSHESFRRLVTWRHA